MQLYIHEDTIEDQMWDEAKRKLGISSVNDSNAHEVANLFAILMDKVEECLRESEG